MMTIEPNTITTMPVLALRGLTIFPNMLLHFDVGRGASIKALDEAMTEGLPIFLVAQRDLTMEEPGEKDLYTVGTVSNVKQILRLPGDNVRVMVEGSSRGRLVSLGKTTPFLQGEVEVLPAPEHTRNTPKTEALIRSTYELFERYAELSPRMTGDVLISVLSSEDPGYIADYIAQNIAMRASDKQAILEELQPVRRLTKLAHALSREVSILELEQEVQSKVREQLSDNQRDYVLREQLKVLRQELGRARTATASRTSTVPALRRLIFRRRRPKRRRRNSHGWPNSPLAPPRPPSSETIWMCYWICPGTSTPKSAPMWRRPGRCWTPTTTASRR